MSRQLAEILVKDKIISPQQFTEAAAVAKDGKSYIRFLIEKKYVAETKLLYYLSQKFGVPSINLAKFEVSPDVVKLVSPDVAKKNQIIPVQVNKGSLVVALCDPSYMSTFEDLKFKIKMQVEAVLTSYTAFDAAMGKYFGGSAYVGAAIETFKKETKAAAASAAAGGPTEQTGGGTLELFQVHDIDTTSSDSDAPVVTLVNGILSEGIRRGASDIHVEPYEKRFRIRMRVDGTLIEIAEVPTEMKRAVTARLKIMARMDISESRVPQDGRIKLKAGGKDVDFRVNSMPTLFGEKVVLRMLSKGNLQLDLMKLGFEQQQLDVFKKGIYAPNGMVLVTGPTGSGKTTTLYSALSELNQIGDNLSTAEDPVEYNLEGINQVQIQKDVGLTFASVLRALLRQDPDTVLVGEIRDFETAEVAVQAALTGHLVLSTLHTNDAPSTITRLMNMGLEPFLVVAALNTVVAQRLLRTVCQACKVETLMAPDKLIQLGFPREIVSTLKLYKGKGCQACNNTGYKGRVAIYEVLDFNQTMKEMLLKGATAIDLRKQAVKDGMKSLRMSALTKVATGNVSLEEAMAMTLEG